MNHLTDVFHGLNTTWHVMGDTVLKRHFCEIDFEMYDRILLAYMFRIGVTNVEHMRIFEQPPSSLLNLIPNRFYEAAEALKWYMRSGSVIYIYGDYDTDGIMSASMLLDYLMQLGYKLGHNLFYEMTYYADGYGLSSRFVNKILEKYSNSVVIVLDTGSSNEFLMRTLASRVYGMTLVLDHHIPSPAVASMDYSNYYYLNPKSLDSPLLVQSSTAGLTYLFLQVLDEVMNFEGLASSYADLAAVGTIADYVPYSYVNKSIVQDGITQMQTFMRPFFQYIGDFRQDAYAINSDTFSKTVGFYIAPKINATGRTYNANLVVRAMLAGMRDRAEETLIQDIQTIKQVYANVRQVREAGYNVLMQQMEARYGQTIPHIVYLETQNIEKGVLSSLSSRLCGELNKPVIIIDTTSEHWSGSGRIPDNLMTVFPDFAEALRQSEVFEVKGHSSAFGVSLKTKDADKIESALGDINGFLEPYAFIIGPHKQFVDGVVNSLSEFHELYAFFKAMAPFRNVSDSPRILLKNYQAIKRGGWYYLMDDFGCYMVRPSDNARNVDINKLVEGCPVVVTPLTYTEKLNGFGALMIDDVITE